MTSLAAALFSVQTLLLFASSQSFTLRNCTIESSEAVVVACQRRELQEIPNDIPRDVEVLEISSNKITQINVTDLKYFHQLAVLRVTHNQLCRIDDYAFANSKELKMLYVSHNKLTRLTENMFVGLKKLTTLDFSHNRISNISPKAFQPLLNVHFVNLDYNSIKTFTDTGMLFKLPKIERIYLGSNNLSSFDSDELLLNTSRVKSISLAFGPLKRFSLKQDIFPYLRSIEMISSKSFEWNVANNSFLKGVRELYLGRSTVGLETFVAMLNSTRNLKSLSLTSMTQAAIKERIEVACSIKSITQIRLSFNVLWTVDNQMLSRCFHVTELKMPLNQIREMSDQSLDSIRHLRVLDLSENHLKKVPLTVRRLSTLQELYLSYNTIAEIDCLDFANLTELITLSLRRNHIISLDECAFQNLHNLNTLDLGGNAVRFLQNPFRECQMPKLKTLLFTNNVERFTLQRGEFRNLSSLHVLNLKARKNLFSQDGPFEGLHRLRKLVCATAYMTKEFFEGLYSIEWLEVHLSSQLMNPRSTSQPPFSVLPNLKQLVLFAAPEFSPEILPNIFSGLKALKYLKADHFFRLTIHPDTFKDTPQLTSLDLSNGDLSFLSPKLFQPVAKLQQIDLSNNKLSAIDFLANLKSLKMLKVGDNHLSVINKTIFQTLPALTYLDLSKNTLLCDCLNADFLEWVKTSNQTQVVDGYSYQCVSPVTQKKERFLDFDTHGCWIDVGFICFTSSSSLILLTLVASFVYHFLRFQLVFAYYLFLAHLYDTKRKKRGGRGGHLYDAFISYNVHDEDWVYNEMLPVLEGEQGWRLCLHHRDFEPGKPIVENITDGIYGSRKTICMISQHYLQSEWCSREIQMASVRLFDEKKDVLVLVFLEDIPTWQLSPYYQIRRVVKKRTFLSWPQAALHKGVFWQKINQALATDNNPEDDKHLIIEPGDHH